MSIKHSILKLFRTFGYNISRYTPRSHPLPRRKQLLTTYNIDVILDIGANSGQFAQVMRGDLTFTKKIISFEPLSSAFKLLEKNAHGQSNWDIYNFALGNKDEIQKINISGNSYSSSLLDMLPAHLKAAPESEFVGIEEIQVKKLDTIFSDFCKPTDNIYMKIDTQGFESRVLNGAENSLKHIDTIQLEMSLQPMYDGEMPFDEMCAYMKKHGYSLIGIEPGFANGKTGELLQVDGIFHRM